MLRSAFATDTLVSAAATASPANPISLNGTPQYGVGNGYSQAALQSKAGLTPVGLSSLPVQQQQVSQYSSAPDVKKEEKPRNLDDEELNSGDELSDGEADQEIDNYCVCMFEKMSRTKTKRKATLIHGVARIHGRDYIFSKAAAEFDW
jgi:hypothetical protein